ncbi:MAG TPA: hypothetical protein VF244_07010 [Acidimicrobiales bacterium]
MATFIDHVRCGECDAGITLEAGTVVLQRYRRQPWLRHFWVRCDACAAHKLYWPTARQVRLAERLQCRDALDDGAPADVRASYARSKGLPVTSRRPPLAILDKEIGFLTSMLAATSGPRPAAGPVPSYLPAHWAN